MTTHKASGSRSAEVLTFQDLTDFRGETDQQSMNGWVREAGATAAVVIHLQPENEDFLYGADLTRHEGALISKTITGLVPGESYQVSFQGKKSENIIGNAASIPWIAVHVDGSETIAPQRLAYLHLWTNYSGRFVATSTSAKVEFISVTKNPNGGDVPTQGFRNYHLDDIAITGRFRDLTDFNDETTGQWVKGPVAATAIYADGGGLRGNVLRFPTPLPSGHQGDILVRTLTDLIPGIEYTISLEATRDIDRYTAPSLQFRLDDAPFGDAILPKPGVWETFQGTFIASGSVNLKIHSLIATAYGNDYSLNDILIVEAGSPSK